jgi:hypothetical protein
MPSDYTPTTEEVRAAYAADAYGVVKKRWLLEFDRWLAAHDRQVAENAIRDAVEWARSCSGESADAAADYIEEMAALGGEAND